MARISNGFSKLLDERIAALKRMRETLDGCIGCGCLSLQNCALYTRDDRAGRRGPGPRYALGERPDINP